MADEGNVVTGAQRTAARVAALAFPISLAFLAYANFGVRAPLMASADPAGKMRIIAGAESLFRLSVVFDLVYVVGLVFWALSSTLFGWLWLRSRYIPAALAHFGVVASAWCLFCAMAYISSSSFANFVNVWLFDMPMALFYITLSFWLLFKGIRGKSVSE